MAIHQPPFPLCFPRMFSVSLVPSTLCPSLPLVFWCVLVIDILANGCISFSRRFTRAPPYIIGVYMQPVLLYNPFSFLSS